jgi:type II secretory pathway pseudopilin PulG
MKKNQKQNGYSLVEIMVAVSLFAFEIIIVLSIFQMVNKSQKNAIASQNIQENLRYAFEVMSKELRQAVRSDNNCPIHNGSSNYRVYNRANVNINSVNYDALYFKKLKKDESGTPHQVCVYYYIADNRLHIYRDYINDTPEIIEQGDITPNEIKINSFSTDITDNLISATPGSLFQPRVNFRISAEMATSSPENKQTTLVQTTVSARSYEDTVY